MIAVDTNILVYAFQRGYPLHEAAKARLTELAEGGVPWALPVFCVGEFLRVTTHPRLCDSPATPGEATAAIDALVASPTLRLLSPGRRYWSLLRDAILEARVRGNLIFDAQIVALCREHGVAELLTEDRDFARFRDLRTVTL